LQANILLGPRLAVAPSDKYIWLMLLEPTKYMPSKRKMKGPNICNSWHKPEYLKLLKVEWDSLKSIGKETKIEII
jgi:hypothetical protein